VLIDGTPGEQLLLAITILCTLHIFSSPSHTSMFKTQ
jgi:hypothetical protein